MAAIVEEPSCGNCKYWEQTLSDNDLGECLRYPPVICGGKDLDALIPKEVALRCTYPVTYLDNLCGEWKRCKKDNNNS